MRRSFWLNKPVEVSSNTETRNILSSEQLLEKVNKEIEINRFQLDYKVFSHTELTDEKCYSILDFINKNYVTSTDDSFKLIYTLELFKFYIHGALVLEFYPKNKHDTVVGYIVGKKSNLMVKNTEINTSEVNFLCVIPRLRSLGLSSYMINVITREIVVNYDINTAHYTISAKIKSPHFGDKSFYHRLINPSQLIKTQFISEEFDDVLNTSNVFNVSKNFVSTHTITYLHNQEIDESLLSVLYDRYMTYCQKTYHIYEDISLDEFRRTFYNSAFHHFIIYKNENIVSYVCLFRLDAHNTETKESQKSGYYYYMFFEEDIYLKNVLEFINKFIYDNQIFDVITFSDIFDIDYKLLKCIKGSGGLRYYLYNMICNPIENNKNGLITI